MALLPARIRAQRRIVLPKEVVEHLGVNVGDVVMFALRPKGKVTVRSAESPNE